jgi:hypothetical protein
MTWTNRHAPLRLRRIGAIGADRPRARIRGRAVAVSAAASKPASGPGGIGHQGERLVAEQRLCHDSSHGVGV